MFSVNLYESWNVWEFTVVSAYAIDIEIHTSHAEA